MSQADKAISMNDLDTESKWDFGSPTPPPDFDPNAQGGGDSLPAGWHRCGVKSFSITQNRTLNYKGTSWVGNQLNVVLECDSGKFEGCVIFDFLPMPTANAPFTSAWFANRWANFMKAIGYDLPPDSLFPKSGFALKQLLPQNGAKQAWVRVIDETYEGKTKQKVQLFGYRPLNDPPPTLDTNAAEAPAAKSATTQPKQQAANTQATTTAQKPGISLDDL